MAAVAPNLPAQGFPCWVRAMYSWGGETKGDLGFVEGDLIEALNAGDSNYWCGRLRRDKRSVGLFPSNFVKVLDQTFQPVSRSVSPMPSSAARNSTPPKASKSVFRKPFTAYSAATGTGDVSRNSSTAAPAATPQNRKAGGPTSLMALVHRNLQRQLRKWRLALKPLRPCPQDNRVFSIGRLMKNPPAATILILLEVLRLSHP